MTLRSNCSATTITLYAPRFGPTTLDWTEDSLHYTNAVKLQLDWTKVTLFATLMEREVVAFQVFLTTEAVVAEVAYESFGRILCEGRLSASPLDARLLSSTFSIGSDVLRSPG